MEYIEAIIYTLGQGFCFNILLPVWYLVMQITEILG